jgi:hypothetical protein
MILYHMQWCAHLYFWWNSVNTVYFTTGWLYLRDNCDARHERLTVIVLRWLSERCLITGHATGVGNHQRRVESLRCWSALPSTSWLLPWFSKLTLSLSWEFRDSEINCLHRAISSLVHTSEFSLPSLAQRWGGKKVFPQTSWWKFRLNMKWYRLYKNFHLAHILDWHNGYLAYLAFTQYFCCSQAW